MRPTPPGPVWAQGAAMAMEDALVPADVLARQADWSTVGERFERLRRARVDHFQATTHKMSRLARLPTWLRDAGDLLLGPRHTARRTRACASILCDRAGCHAARVDHRPACQT